MKKIDKVVIKETIYIALSVLVLSMLLQGVFLIINKWDITVLYGNLLSGVAAILNFFVMGLTVQSCVGKDEKQTRQTMKASNAMRMLGLFVVGLVGLLLPVFNTITVIIPLFFPRIAINFRPLFSKIMDEEVVINNKEQTEEDTSKNWEEDNE